MKVSRTGVVVSAVPSAVMLVLFYSLAIHMRCSLGAWPTSIGNRGFAPGLISHGELTSMFCGILTVATVWGVPIAFLVCLLARSCRRFVIYLAVYTLVYAMCWGVMLLAPAPFLHWWWD
jgi:hypothetical protein